MVRWLDLAHRVRHQEQRQRGPKVYSLHAPEVECIGKGKARAPYEFGCKVSIATPATTPKGGQFVLHAKALQAIHLEQQRLGGAAATIRKLEVDSSTWKCDRGLERSGFGKGARQEEERGKGPFWH